MTSHNSRLTTSQFMIINEGWNDLHKILVLIKVQEHKWGRRESAERYMTWL
jgi:hypothetical protein